MSAAAGRRSLLAALALLALGGLLLHYRIHPYAVPDKLNPGQVAVRASLVPATLLSLADLVLVTALFAFRRTAPLGLLLNGMIVIYGTVLMGHFSIAQLAFHAPTLADWALRSTLPDIALAWGDFFVGKALYDSWMREA